MYTIDNAATMTATTPQDNESMAFEFDEQHLQHWSSNSSIRELIDFIVDADPSTIQECNLPTLNDELDDAIEFFDEFDNIDSNHPSFGREMDIPFP